MTHEQRTHIRNAINQHKRQQLEARAAANPAGYCTGCKTPIEDPNPECPQCHDRLRQRQRKAQTLANRPPAKPGCCPNCATPRTHPNPDCYLCRNREAKKGRKFPGQTTCRSCGIALTLYRAGCNACACRKTYHNKKAA